MRRLLAALVAVALPFAGALLPASAQDAPRQPDGTLAVPPLARVTDLAGVLSPADRARIEGQLAAFEAKKGSQIAVLVVPSTKPEPIADFAQRVGDAWKIGRKGVGDGVLMAIAIQDRQIWISVALALEGAIPDVTAARISREVIAPRFRDGRFADGIADGLDRIFRQIEGEKLPEPSAAFDAIDRADVLLATLMPIVIVGVIVGTVLRRLIGGAGALVAGGGAGAASWIAAASLGAALVAGFAVLILSFGAVGSGGGRAVGGRRGGGFTPGGWSGGSSSGGWSGGSSSGGGWSSGGGGSFSGGGGGSSW